MKSFIPIINTNAKIPEPIFDSLFILEVRSSMKSPIEPVSKQAVLDHLSGSVEGFVSDDFKETYLTACP